MRREGRETNLVLRLENRFLHPTTFKAALQGSVQERSGKMTGYSTQGGKSFTFAQCLPTTSTVGSIGPFVSIHRGSLDTSPTYVPCFRCGICCRSYQVRINLAEAKYIANRLKISWDEFITNYIDSRYLGEEQFLLRHEHGACIFLRQLNAKLTSCRIHPFKPSSCRDWAPSQFRRECQRGLAELWCLKVDENGNLQGDLENLTRFYSFLHLYCIQTPVDQ